MGKVELGSPQHTMCVLEQISFRGAGLSPTLELPVVRGSRMVYLYTTVSSAYSKISVKIKKQLMYKLNNSGLKAHPCGTPLLQALTQFLMNLNRNMDGPKAEFAKQQLVFEQMHI